LASRARAARVAAKQSIGCLLFLTALAGLKFKKHDNTFWKTVNFAQTQSSTSLQPVAAMFSLAVVKFRTGRRHKRVVNMVRTKQFT
jgi:hypothetical protein